MQIVQFTAENIKTLKLVDITPTKNFIQITGKNGSGKTSVLDAMWWALAGADAIQGQPIRKGTETARIRLDLGEMIVTRKFTASGTTLTVENAEGFRAPTPQKMLDAIIGQMTFDPLEFSRLGGADQFNALKKIAEVDLDFEALAQQDKDDTVRRRDINRDIKNLEGQLTGISVAEDAPDAPVVMADLLESLRRIENDNAVLQNEEDAQANLRKRQKAAVDRLEILNAQIAQAKEDVITLTDLVTALRPITYKSTDSVKEKIAGAESLNRKHADKMRHGQINAEIALKTKASGGIDDELAARKAKIIAALAESKMPIPGLSLGDKIVMFNEIPFDQLSAAEQLKVSVAIAMAANPTLKVIRIKDGSLLDDDSLKIIQDMAADREYQVWCERVDSSGKIGIVMEDGEVKAVNDGEAA